MKTYTDAQRRVHHALARIAIDGAFDRMTADMAGDDMEAEYRELDMFRDAIHRANDRLLETNENAPFDEPYSLGGEAWENPSQHLAIVLFARDGMHGGDLLPHLALSDAEFKLYLNTPIPLTPEDLPF